MTSSEQLEKPISLPPIFMLGSVAVLAVGGAFAVEGLLGIVNPPTPNCDKVVVASDDNEIYVGAHVEFNGYNQPVEITYLTNIGVIKSVIDDPSNYVHSDLISISNPVNSKVVKVSAEIYKLNGQPNEEASPIADCKGQTPIS